MHLSYRFHGTVAIIFSCLIPDLLIGQFVTPPPATIIDEVITLEMNQAYARFGYSLASGGDINNDGYGDVIISADMYDNGQTDEGAVFVYFGGPTGISAFPTWTKEGDQVSAYFGRSAACAGDINGDGYDDVIIGAQGYDNGQIDEGKVFLYLGSAAGLSTTPSWTYESDQAGAAAGSSVASAGDVNGDGYDDIQIGVVSYDSSDGAGGFDYNVSKIVVFHGSSTGIQPGQQFSYSSFYGGTGLGVGLKPAGDVNGDGFDDILVPEAVYGWDGDGLIRVFWGSADGISPTGYWTEGGHYESESFGIGAGAGDVNGDGYSDIIAGGINNGGYSSGGKIYAYYGGPGGLSNIESWSYATDQIQADYGYSVDVAGDVNNDGFDDIVVGAPYYDKGQTNEGVFFVITGSAAGLPGTTTWVAQVNQIEARFGYRVAGTGDINNDGFADFAATALLMDNGQTDEGQVRLYSGNPGCFVPPAVSLDFGTGIICYSDGPVLLTSGTPSGGYYTGTGIEGTNTFNPTTAGIGVHTISYTYIDPAGCSATASDALNVESNPVASATLGSASLNLCLNTPVVLVANTGTGFTYQWYKNGTPIPGAVFLSYLAYTTGNYQVETTNPAGCSKLSKKRKVTHSGCRSESEPDIRESIALYPNPSAGKFTFDWRTPGLKDGIVSLTIYNLNGQAVAQQTLEANAAICTSTIEVTLPPGMYWITAVQEELRIFQKLIIE